MPIFLRIFHFVVVHTVWWGQWSRCFSGIHLLSLWSSECWQFDLWFFCLFETQLVYLEVLHSSMLKLSLKNSEHNLTSMGSECNCLVVWTFFSPTLLWNWDENWLFQTCGHCQVFQICWHAECSTFTASSFRIWNSSDAIPSPPVACNTSYSLLDSTLQDVLL